MVGPVGVKALTQLEFELRAYKFLQEIQTSSRVSEPVSC